MHTHKKNMQTPTERPQAEPKHNTAQDDFLINVFSEFAPNVCYLLLVIRENAGWRRLHSTQKLPPLRFICTTTTIIDLPEEI